MPMSSLDLLLAQSHGPIFLGVGIGLTIIGVVVGIRTRWSHPLFYINLAVGLFLVYLGVFSVPPKRPLDTNSLIAINPGAVTCISFLPPDSIRGRGHSIVHDPKVYHDRSIIDLVCRCMNNSEYQDQPILDPKQTGSLVILFSNREPLYLFVSKTDSLVSLSYLLKAPENSYKGSLYPQGLGALIDSLDPPFDSTFLPDLPLHPESKGK